MLENKRILFIGNIAQNGYLMAKFLRGRNLHADLLIYSYTHLMGQPEWEDAEVSGCVPHWGANWSRHAPGFRRPAWVHEVRPVTPSRLRRLWSRLRRRQVCPSVQHVLSPRRCGELRSLSASRLAGITGELTPADLDYALAYCRCPGIPRELLETADIIVGTGLDAAVAMILAPRKVHVAFEHGTMRDLPFEDSSWGRVLALAYTQADRCIITNPDCLAAAKKLRLDTHEFMPHPIDWKYSTRSDQADIAVRLRRGASFLVFAPARHDWSVKGNDIVLRGFAEMTRRTGDRQAKLLLLEWGDEIDRSRALTGELGITDHVIWLPVVCALELSRLFKACDVVLDQFVLGVFGSTVPQAMACGKPVISSYDESANGWAFADRPPVCDAANHDEIAAHLHRLHRDEQYRLAVGRQGAQWYQAHHCPERVTDRLVEILIAAAAHRRDAR